MNRKERRAEKFGHFSDKRVFYIFAKNQKSNLFFNVAIPLEDKDAGQHFFIEERSMFIAGEIERARDEVSIDILNYCEEAFFLSR